MLLRMEVNPLIIQWVFSFLTDRRQRVRIAGPMDVWSDQTVTNTGAPQGCVISPALFTLYMADCRCGEPVVLQIKFSDDTSIAGMVTQGDETAYRSAVADMAAWNKENHLLLNVSKTKEVIIDFRKNPPAPLPLQINGDHVESVQEYKYLGTSLDSKLDWSRNAAAILKKGHQRLYFLRKMRSFNVQPAILMMFYQAMVESILSYNTLCFNVPSMMTEK